MQYSRENNCEDCTLKCELFLTAKEMELEEQLAPTQVNYKKHELICKQNESVSHVIILTSGHAKMYIDGINNKNIILNILVPSNHIGLVSVFASSAYLYNVAAISNCKTCHIDIDFIKMMYLNNSDFLNKINQDFVHSVSVIMKKLISLNQKQIRGKVAESLIYLSQLYDSNNFILTITRKELGELSATSEENAVRVLSELKTENIIDINGKEITIKDINILNKISLFG